MPESTDRDLYRLEPLQPRILLSGDTPGGESEELFDNTPAVDLPVDTPEEMVQTEVIAEDALPDDVLFTCFMVEDGEEVVGEEAPEGEVVVLDTPTDGSPEIYYMMGAPVEAQSGPVETPPAAQEPEAEVVALPLAAEPAQAPQANPLLVKQDDLLASNGEVLS